jgi:uncharacterized delta-60 repeat protein
MGCWPVYIYSCVEMLHHIMERHVSKILQRTPMKKERNNGRKGSSEALMVPSADGDLDSRGRRQVGRRSFFKGLGNRIIASDVNRKRLTQKRGNGEEEMRKFARSILPGLLALDLIFGVKPACGAAGSLDPTFGKGGVTVTSFASQGDVIPYSIKLQTDGKILVLVVAGGETGEVLRYTSTGTLETTFGSNGIATLPTPISTFGSMALQSNGQIVLAGEVTDPSSGAAAFGVQRLNTNGTVDTGFGSGGLAVASMGFPGTQAVLLIQPNGDILLGAQLEPIGRGQPFHTALARFGPTGALDPTFGSSGTVSVPAVGGCTALALLSDGEILVVNANEIAQFTSSGSLESKVTGGTIVASAGSENPSTASVFQPNGDYLLATEVAIGAPRNHNFAAEVLRFTPTGSADSTFANPTFRFTGNGGTAVEDVINGIAVPPNGNIVVAGLHSTSSSTVNALARLTSNGSFDSAFGTGGIVTNSVPAGTGGLRGVVIQPADGKIVVVGTANNLVQLTLSRYLGQ